MHRLVALLLFPLLFLAGMSPLSSTAEAAGCSSLTVAGGVMPGGDVLVFLHHDDRLLRLGRANGDGKFSVRLCKTKRLSTYAARHQGKVNLDVVAHRHGRRGFLYSRTTSAPIGSSRVELPGRLTAAGTVSPTVAVRAARQRSLIATGAAFDDSLFVNLPTLHVQVVRGVVGKYRISSETFSEMKVSLGTPDGGFAASGSMSIAGTTGFSRTKKLVTPPGQRKAAVEVRPELRIDREYVCYHPSSPLLVLPWWIQRETRCSTQTTGSWTGDIKTPATRFRACDAGPAHYQWMNNRNDVGVHVANGLSLGGEVEVGALGTLAYSTKFSGATQLEYTFKPSDHRRTFCVGGNGEDVAHSAKLYISKKPGGTGPCVPPECYAV